MPDNVVDDDDALFRHVVSPIAFRQRAFAPEKFVHLVSKEDGVHGSLGWGKILSTINDVHGYGARLASFMNDCEAQMRPLTAKNTRVYCGAYELIARDVRALSTTRGLDEIETADVIHQPENGEDAHLDLKIVAKAGLTIDEGTKTAIVDRLWNSCVAVHQFSDDGRAKDQQNWPNALPLPSRSEHAIKVQV